MGKIVKYCAACDESFAEKFGFCPNCGQAMSAFEMNPMGGQTAAGEEATASASDTVNFTAQTTSSNSFDKSPVVESSLSSTVVPFSARETQNLAAENKTERFAEISAESATSAPETENVLTKKAVAANGNGNGYYASNQDSRKTFGAPANLKDDGFRVTVMEEKNVKQRNLLLLGSMFFMVMLCLGGVVYSLFAKDLFIGAIDDGGIFAFVPVVDEPPMEVEEKPKPKDNKDAGGGGGGGRKEETPTSKGRLATQTEEPLIAPTKTIPQKDNFELKQIASTQGNIKRKATDEAYGDPNSKYSLSSDGTGSGGGQGSGTGTGQGSGRGTGEGSGIGSGSGRGTGNGNGDGRGDGNQGRTAVTSPPPPPPKKVEPVGVTESVKIISKPKALYSDPARQNQVQGTVRLRVTFSANGQIAGISAVSGLPYGLTEQAIAAARAIKFEPAKKNGVPISVTKQVEYNFTMY
ncbi:MAG: energy transducer TonB [Acidobacteria bacterium]|nr:energy transducer TonB [Acidobacteriota bacterium]